MKQNRNEVCCMSLSYTVTEKCYLDLWMESTSLVVVVVMVATKVVAATAVVVVQ